MLLEALLDPFALLSAKQSKQSNRAVTINLNTLIKQSKSFQVKIDSQLKIVINEARIACEETNKD